MLLRELEDSQIPEFVERYTKGEVSPSLLQTVLEANNPLLRLPLFLSLVVRMSGSPLPDLQRRLCSRSGLVAQYVEFLLQRDLSRNSSAADVLALDRLRDALDLLSQAFQTAGQVLQLADARKTIEAGAPGRPEEARKILDDLCERGLLATDGHSLRFWHQTIQEYFYAGSIVHRWRGSKKHIGRMPWSLRRLAAKPEEEETLSFVIAHLHDDEIEAALRFGLRINPALTISWADDLNLETRAEPTTERFPEKIRQFALAARRYTTVGFSPAAIFFKLGFLGFGLGVQLWLWSNWYFNWDNYMAFATFCGLGCLPLLDAILLCPSAKQLEAILGAIPAIRAASLRKNLGTLAQELSHSRLTRQDIRMLAQSVSVMEVVNGKKLIMSLRTSKAPYSAVRFIGHLDTPSALPVLEKILRLNNFLSLAALEALAFRATRLRTERPRIKDLLWAVWKDSEMDYKIRQRARKFLLQTGDDPGGRWRLFQYFTLRFLTFLAFGLCVGLCLTVFSSGLPTYTGRRLLLVLLIGMAALLFWDARRIGVRIIEQRFEEVPASHWTAATLLAYVVFIPLYFLNRQRMIRDATPVNWDALLPGIADGHEKE